MPSWTAAALAGSLQVLARVALQHDLLANLRVGRCDDGIVSGPSFNLSGTLSSAAIGSIAGGTFGVIIGALTGSVLLCLEA